MVCEFWAVEPMARGGGAGDKQTAQQRAKGKASTTQAALDSLAQADEGLAC